MADTRIEWARKSWNPVTGCTPISRGCDHCYAARFAKRLAGRCGYPKDKPFAVTLHPEKLDGPLHWRKPSRVFVCSMGDLFHEDVPPEFAWQVFNVIAECPQHTFVILTKRILRARDIIHDMLTASSQDALPDNCWLGVSVEDQATAEERIPLLMQIPAAVRVVSLEPLLGAVDLRNLRTGPDQPMEGYPGVTWHACGDALHKPAAPRAGSTVVVPAAWSGLDWVICGGETGPAARPMHPDWVRKVRDDCAGAPLRAAVGPGVPFFFKSWGDWLPAIQDGAPGPGQVLNASDEPVRVGKKRAGRLLDSRTHDEAPDGPAR